MSAFKPILAVTMLVVAETFKSVIDKMKYGSNLKLSHLLQMENAYLTHADLNTNIAKRESWLNNHFVSYDS